jgi:hypothetical protein
MTMVKLQQTGTPRGRVGVWKNVTSFHFCATFAAFRMGDQRSISAFTNWPNRAGVRSLLGGIDPPSSASFAATPGSSRALSSAAASFSTIGFGVSLGAKIPAQMLML